MPARAASNHRYSTESRKPPYTRAPTVRGRTLLLLGIAAVVLFGLVSLIGDGSDTLSYRGERYAGGALATAAEAERAEVVPTGDLVRGKPAFVERRTPSRVLFLLRPDGRYDVFSLVEEP